jgi:hypothetical protein
MTARVWPDVHCLSEEKGLTVDPESGRILKISHLARRYRTMATMCSKGSPPHFSGAGTAVFSGVLLFFCLFTAGIAPAYGAEGNGPAEEVSETVDINIQDGCPSIPGLPQDSKAVKGFSHRLHAEKYLRESAGFSGTPEGAFVCAACHSGAKSPEDISGESACDRLSERLSESGGAQNLKKYFHDMCMTCHKDMGRAGQKTGPVKCAGCHAQ